jgi:CDP-diacylglycerol--glycerol-3-phosphate 3-phosphatidyltransferase
VAENWRTNLNVTMLKLPNLLYKTAYGDLLAGALFAVASLTDALDGHLARSRNAITKLGTILDPIADKLLIAGATVALVSLGRLAAWVAVVIIVREVAVTLLRMWAVRRGQSVAASGFGKVKTVTQVAMVFALIMVPAGEPWTLALVYTAVAATVLSGLDYCFGAQRLTRVDLDHCEQTSQQVDVKVPR